MASMEAFSSQPETFTASALYIPPARKSSELILMRTG
jgi:hypothetical protein